VVQSSVIRSSHEWATKSQLANVTLPESQWIKIECSAQKWNGHLVTLIQRTGFRLSECYQWLFPFSVTFPWTKLGYTAQTVPENTSAFNLRQARILREYTLLYHNFTKCLGVMRHKKACKPCKVGANSCHSAIKDLQVLIVKKLRTK